ncbi:MAG TPA: hypothetical protein VN524_17105 [Hyphomicrobiaceae bacterium]|jgi:hypothetical protein|nr:hypothetical protein [Hyphomicrobiaceae bacterium]
MSIPKMRHVAFGLATAGVLAGGLLMTVGHPLRGATAEPASSAASPPVDRDGSGVRTDPSASVNIDRERGKVTVRAPHADVDVDPDKGQVQVRAPYVNLDIRW